MAICGLSAPWLCAPEFLALTRQSVPVCLAMLECIDEEVGLWSAERVTKQGFSLRTTALRLRDGSLALVSPTRGLEDEIAELGTPSLLIAPNHFHHLGLSSYSERWPEAKVLCSDTARPRLLKKSRIAEFGSLDVLRDRLGEHVQVLEPPELKTGEIFLRVATASGAAWVVSDAFFNLEAHPKGMVGVFCRFTGTSPGVRIGRTFTALAVKSKPVYGKWLRAQLEADRPSVLVPGHGEICREQTLYALLDAQTRRRLRS